MIITDPRTIVDFLRGYTRDYRGRTFDDILNSSDEEMEHCHDAIQQIFPLNEFSKHAWTYPVLTKETVAMALKYEDVMGNILRAEQRMRSFLGMKPNEDIDKQRKWCRDYNHNLLRVTRVIRCLCLFGMNRHAEDFYNEVVKIGNYFGISSTTLNYWNRALVEDPWTPLQD